MQIGINLLLWNDSPDEGSESLLTAISDWGFNLAEFPIYGQSEKTMVQLGRILDRLGLARTAVTTCTQEQDLASSNADIRSAGIDYLKRILDRSATAGCQALVGPLHSALGTFSGQFATEDQWKWSTDAMQIVSEYAAQLQIKIALEPVNRFECYLMNSTEQAVRYVQRVNHPSCGILYDTFHAHIEEKKVAQALSMTKPHLFHIHISENDRSTPGTGQVDWKTTFETWRQMNVNCPLVIEAFGSSLPNIAAATKIWRRMFNSEEELAREGLAFIKKECNIQ